MKTITLTDFEAEVLAHHICERLHRLGKTVESTTQMTVLEDAEIQRKFYLQLLEQLGYKQEDFKFCALVLRQEPQVEDDIKRTEETLGMCDNETAGLALKQYHRKQNMS